jgi:hypothetical protein
LAIIIGRLSVRFKNVPGVTTADIADWVAEAEFESGLFEGEDASKDNALLYLAYSIGCTVIATDAARYFKYTDGEEQIDKTNIAANYLELAKDARKSYRKALRGGYASSSHVERADYR